MRTRELTGAIIAAVALLAGCSKDEPKPDPAATKPAVGASAPAVPLASVALVSSGAASAVASALPAGAVRFAIDPKSKTSIDMPAPKEHIKAKTEAAAGTFTVDPTNLAASRGEVKVDLTTLTTYTFGDKDKDATQTEHARTWLEAVVDGKTNDTMRWATFTIRSLDGLSATDASKVTPTKEGADDVRVVTLTAKGTFAVHGKTADKEVPLEVRLHYPSGAAPDSKPTKIDIKSKAPMRITLADHDVKPRDSFGKIASRAFDLLGTKVANVADVSMDLSAAPTP
jgi:polyisoprenoid-binding protein YceI